MEIVKLESIRTEIQQKMYEMGFTPEKFTEEAHSALNIWNDPKNTYLRTATVKSFYNALLNLCKVNLTLNPIKKEAYLVPRKNGDQVEVFLEPSYIGLAKLVIDEGLITNIQTNLIYEGDLFEIDYGNMNGFKHVPYFARKTEKGAIVGVYAMAYLRDGNFQFEHMDKEDVERIKEKSESYKAYKNGKTKSAIWVDYESEMFRKTVLRRLIKYIPRTNRNNFIDEAVYLDESGFKATHKQITLIDSLIQTSGISEEKKCEIESDYVTMSSMEAKKWIEYLKENQFSPIDRGNMSATEIKKQTLF